MKCLFLHCAIHFHKPCIYYPHVSPLCLGGVVEKWGSHRSGTLSQLRFHLVSLEIQFPVNDFLEFHSGPLRCSGMTHFCLEAQHRLLLIVTTVHIVHAYS